jgi:ABC-type transport system involved in multi-copper enzyme maturation permease subunit
MCIVPSYSSVFINLLLSSASYRFRTLDFIDIYLHSSVLTILLQNTHDILPSYTTVPQQARTTAGAYKSGPPTAQYFPLKLLLECIIIIIIIIILHCLVQNFRFKEFNNET